jgi:hypothetical protein
MVPAGGHTHNSLGLIPDQQGFYSEATYGIAFAVARIGNDISSASTLHGSCSFMQLLWHRQAAGPDEGLAL